MESTKLKNIILVILVVTNLFLLSIVIRQQLSSSHYQRQTLSDAVTLLERTGIAVRADQLPTKPHPAPMTVERDLVAEKSAMAALLGGSVTTTDRGLVLLYSGTGGSAELRSDGAFTVNLTPGAYRASGADLGAHTLSVLTQMHYTATLTASDNASRIIALEQWQGYPLFSCRTTATYEAASLTTLSGHRLVGTPKEEGIPQPSLSLATLLLRFRATIMESGDACNAILAVTQGYLTTTLPSGQLRLVPALRIVTDANSYYANALTGEISKI